MSISSIVGRIIPAATTFVASGGNPLATAVSFASADRARDQAKKERMRQARQQEELEKYQMSLIGSNIGQDFSDFSTQSSGVNRAGFGSGFGTFLGDVGRNIVSPITGLLGSIQNFRRPQSVAQQPAITTVTNVGAQETSGSGAQEAFLGGGFGALAQAGRRFFQSPAGQLAFGTGVGGALGLLGPEGQKMRVTRKTKRLAQQSYSLAMGDLGSAISIFAQLSGMSVDERTFVLILTKRFRNDGPVVTKAALRKTKTTIRRMKNMCDMYDSLRPAARRRATPMKRAGTTLISNK